MRKRRKFRPFWCGFDLPAREAQLTDLEKESENPNLWDNQKYAQKLMRKISVLRLDIESWKNLSQRLSDARELAEMGDESLRAELDPETAELAKLVDQKELDTMLAGKHDMGDALLTINAGAGGTDSQDWSAMLQRMLSCLGRTARLPNRDH